MTIAITPLPYERDALEPFVSAETLTYHYDKHYQGYVDKLNTLVTDTPMANQSLEEIIGQARQSGATHMLQNAQQAWNHEFLWESMSPSGETTPEGRIKTLIEESFGDLEAFRRQFRDAALNQFGSGWVWLVQDGETLRILTTSNSDSPVGTRFVPLLTLDVWEHAYYIDHRNERARYIDTFLHKLVNWKFAAANLRKNKQNKAA